MGSGKIEKRGIRCVDGPGCNGIAKADIYLYRDASLGEKRGEGDANAFVIGILLDALRFDGLGVKTQAVTLNFRGRDFAEDLNKTLRGIVSPSQKVGVPSWTELLARPDFEQQSSLQDKDVPVLRVADAEEDSL